MPGFKGPALVAMSSCNWAWTSPTGPHFFQISTTNQVLLELFSFETSFFSFFFFILWQSICLILGTVPQASLEKAKFEWELSQNLNGKYRKRSCFLLASNTGVKYTNPYKGWKVFRYDALLCSLEALTDSRCHEYL